MADIEIKNGEAKTLPFIIKTVAGVVIDVSTATSIDFIVRDGYGSTATTFITKSLTDFTVTDAANGNISCVLTTTDLAYTNIPDMVYLAELKIVFTASTDVDISAKLDFKVRRSLFSD